jgi:isopropylmalate/homocitrate/citramalate synthase
MKDSGMSDSQFMRFQKKKHERINKYIDKYDDEVRIRQLQKRFKEAKKLTIWERLVNWITK